MLSEYAKLSREASDADEGYDQYLLRLTELEVASGKVHSVGPEFAAAVEACTKLSEMGYANFIRSYAATVYIANNQFKRRALRAVQLYLLSAHVRRALDSERDDLTLKVAAKLADIVVVGI